MIRFRARLGEELATDETRKKHEQKTTHVYPYFFRVTSVALFYFRRSQIVPIHIRFVASIPRR